jgi:hypothetical protein
MTVGSPCSSRWAVLAADRDRSPTSRSRSAAHDQTTTVEALHPIHDALRQIAWRPLPTDRHADAAAALDEQLELLDADVRRRFEEDLDRRIALQPDPQGVG